MKSLLERSRYVMLIAVIALFAASVTALAWGAVKTYNTIVEVVTHHGEVEANISFIELMDAFLIAAILYIFAIAIYELFIGDLAMPEWLVINNLDELKSKVAGVLVLVIVIGFAEHFSRWDDPQGLLFSGLGGAAIIGALVLFNRYNSQNH